MAFQMVAYMAVGWFIGNFIDKKLELKEPYIGLLFIILFLGAYFYSLVRDLEKNK
jgi:putative Mn2+ efflux pump MntP